MKINFNCSNMVSVVYPPYGSGNFVINCLSLSDYTLPLARGNNNKTEELLNLKDLASSRKIRQKLISGTLPHKNNMKQWGKYELTAADFFGCSQDPGTLNNLPNITDNMFASYFPHVTASDKMFFYTCHQGVESAIKIFPNSTILLLENFDKIQNISLQLKPHASQLKENTIIHGSAAMEYPYGLLDIDIKYIKQFNGIINTIDMDAMFEFDHWVNEITNLYTAYGFDDFDEELLYSYWKLYMNLHKI